MAGGHQKAGGSRIGAVGGSFLRLDTGITTKAGIGNAVQTGTDARAPVDHRRQMSMGWKRLAASVVVGVTTLGTNERLVAQTPRAASPFAAVRGYVFDSLLTNATMPGARISLSGPTNREIVADGRGRFTTDSLAPGRYQIAFAHEKWEEIGYQPEARNVDLRAGIVTPLFLSSTAGAAIAAGVCPGPRDLEGVVIGGLIDIATNRPVVGGEIRVEWSERVISRELGLTSYLKFAKATSDSLGRYAICSIPTDVAMLFRARVGGVDGPPLELDLKGRPLAIRTLTVDRGAAPDSTALGGTTSSRRTAQLRGTVRAADGSPLNEAQVLVLGIDGGARSSGTGTWQLDSLPGGTHTVEFRAIGFARHRQLVDLKPGQPVEVDVRLARVAVALPELTVKVAPRLAEFDQRRTNMGGAGHFMTRDDIARRNPLRTEELFRTVPGFSVEPSGGFEYRVVSTRGAGSNGRCSPDFYVDGVKTVVDPQTGGGLPVQPGEIHGIESYAGGATTPAQYQSQGGCGAILIWTQRGGRR